MNYYIIKAKSADYNVDIINGIREVDASAELVSDIESCDVAVIQSGLAHSKTAIEEYKKARELGKIVCEGCVYIDRYFASVY